MTLPAFAEPPPSGQPRFGASPPSSRVDGVLVVMAALLTIVTAMVGFPTPAHAAPAPIDVYPVQSIYERSADYRLTVNGREVPVTRYHGYDIAQFAMGSGSATLAVTKINNTSIGAYSISPAKLNLGGSVSGPTLTFTVPNDEYLIVKVDGRPRLVIAIDSAETNRPSSSGSGNIARCGLRSLG
ncbi:hypothetical protein [Streptomyces cavernae]|uniref:hypothetical protein n=1 Tax=Streptomyces cavernae TaxID=2259034 RepID=UPI000FEC0F2F|nr:hypothetical protein [Streptomyces cavernae]